METDTLFNIWAAAIGTVGIITAGYSIYFAQKLKSRFGGVVGDAVNWVSLSVSCTLTLLVVYYTTGIYILITGREYPAVMSHTVLNTLLAMDLIFLYLAARILKEGTDFEEQKRNGRKKLSTTGAR